MTARSSLTVVLAAGEGTRMRSALPKVLHPVASQSLLAHVLGAAPQGSDASLAVVIGPDHEAVADEALRQGARWVKWQVLDWNEPARRFYLSRGAKLTTGWENGSIEICVADAPVD